MSGTIIVDNSGCQIDTHINMSVVKNLSGDYFLKLCCPQVIQISNVCENIASLLIPKCFALGDSFFELKTPNEIIYEYHNMTNGSSTTSDTNGPFQNGYIFFELDDTHETNIICINKIVIPVIAKCINKDKTGSLGTLECVYSIQG